MSDKLQCPYDPVHQIAPNSFGKHLLKCERQHPDMKLARCPLNSFHRFPPEQLKEHLKVCPSRAELESYKYTVGTAASTMLHTYDSKPLEVTINTGPRAAAAAGSLAVDNEVWDDFSYKAYDPVEHCKQRQQTDPTFISPAACKLVGGGGSTKAETEPPPEAVARPLIKPEPAASSEDAPVPYKLTPKQESVPPADRKPYETSAHSSKSYKPYDRADRTRYDGGARRSNDRSYRSSSSDKDISRGYDERSRSKPHEGRVKSSREDSYRYFHNRDYQ
ncbi:protein D7-like [Anopheles aquasalis]|uniref:protein D7-like n=1 Tax=Anopheles aquasalis TaxID=42839 RepID=UPI00215A69D8|nr:protein D7-like [Anopheles aquasalis]